MKSAGIGTAAIVVAVIVVVAAVGVAACLLLIRGGGISEFYGIPVYSGVSRITETAVELENYIMHTGIYSFTVNGVDIYNWYISEMPQRGWLNVTPPPGQGYVEGQGGNINYMKDNNTAIISIKIGTEAQQHGADKVLMIAYMVPK